MSLSILLFVAGILYFSYKLSRIYAPSTADMYRTTRLTLTWFSIFSIVSQTALNRSLDRPTPMLISRNSST